MEQSRRLSEKRNKYIHCMWVVAAEDDSGTGQTQVLGRDRTLKDPPSDKELEVLGIEMLRLVNEVYSKRIEGFIAAALDRQRG